mmetsp:Transcript_42923/g.50348  ORF Transcript_42923/g.50348 Transcript_42923/m.50348 type:complete len:171 (-) Transcript_42923:58-570(-)
MNKNILRAFRRQLKTMFEAFCNSSNLNAGSKKDFVSQVKLFAGHLQKLARRSEDVNGWRPASKTINSKKSRVVDEIFNKSHESVVYLASLVDYCKMKRLLKKSQHQEFLLQVNDLFYKYTHTKFNAFMEIPEVHSIFRMVVNATEVEQFVTKNRVFDSCHDQYVAQINSL